MAVDPNAPPPPGVPADAAPVATSLLTPAPPAAAAGFLDGLTLRGLLFDLAGLGFVGAAIYVGLMRGVTVPEFATFSTAAGAYLGLKASP